MGSYHDYVSDSAVEAYYGWDVDEREPCASCGHTMENHEGEKAEKCKHEDGCDCEKWTEGWEPDWDSMPGGADDPDRVR